MEPLASIFFCVSQEVVYTSMVETFLSTATQCCHKLNKYMNELAWADHDDFCAFDFQFSVEPESENDEQT